MKNKTGVFATSKVDSQGDTLSREHLEQLVHQYNTSWIPVVVEHDPRIEPVGRATAARLVTLEDGVHVAEADFEMFEEGDVIPLADDGREMPLEELQPDQVVIQYDWSYAQSPERLAIVKDIAREASAETQQQFKKSQEPISVLTIAAFFVGGIASGFLKKLGEDAYDRFKKKLKDVFASSSDGKDRLLIFLVVAKRESVTINVQVILTNPSADDIDAFLASGTVALQQALHEHYDPRLAIRQMTYEYRDRQLYLRFAVRKDAVPLLPKRGK